MKATSKKQLESQVKEKTSSWKNTVLTKIADRMARASEDIDEQDNSEYADGSIQSFMQVRDIVGGIVVTRDSRFISILEFSPIDFEQKTDAEKNAIIHGFTRMFTNGPKKAVIKILSDCYQPYDFISEIEKNNEGETDPERLMSIYDYTKHIQDISDSESVVKRFFLITQYEGDETGYKETNIDDIVDSMYEKEEVYICALQSCGNTVHLPDMTADMEKYKQERTRLTTSILYFMFNRKSCVEENVKTRGNRIRSDYKVYNSETGSRKKPNYVDIISPRGLYLDNRNYVFEDGIYKTYLGVKADGWPTVVEPGWVSYLNGGTSVIDVTLILQRIPHELAKKALDILVQSKHGKVRSKQQRHNITAQQDAAEEYEDSLQMQEEIRNADLYNAALILELRSSSPKALGRLKRKVISSYEQFKFEDSWLCEEDYYLATEPFLYTPRFLSRLNHQLTSRNIGYTYPFISFDLNEIKGFLLGKDIEEGHRSLAIINNFDSRYNNGHLLISGRPGSGKTFSEQVISGRASLNGERVTCICPDKGFEWEGLARNFGGSYIRFFPGSDDHVNPMDIRTEAVAEALLADEDAEKEIKRNAQESALSKKIANLNLWFELNLLGNDKNAQFSAKDATLMQQALVRTYAKYGITSDNRSLFEADGVTPKLMPILEDWQKEVAATPELKQYAYVFDEYVTGQSKNFNCRTTADLTRKVTVFDVNNKQIMPALIPAFMFLAFSISYDRIKEDIKQRDLLVLDEVWMMMSIEKVAEQVRDAIKLMRSFYGAVLIATQELEDFLGSCGNFGKTVINNCTFKLLMGMQREALQAFTSNYEGVLTPDDIETIVRQKKGEGLLIVGDTKKKIAISATDREFAAYNTDRNVKTKPVK